MIFTPDLGIIRTDIPAGRFSHVVISESVLFGLFSTQKNTDAIYLDPSHTLKAGVSYYAFRDEYTIPYQLAESRTPDSYYNEKYNNGYIQVDSATAAELKKLDEPYFFVSYCENGLDELVLVPKSAVKIK